MVIFWNFAGVPFVSSLENKLVAPTPDEISYYQTYCYSIIYMASHDPSKYQFSTPAYIALYATLLTAYYMFVSVFIVN